MLPYSVTADPTAELRGWLTLVWALVVGSATLVGVFVAVRNYVRSTEEARVAVARLVWAEERGPHFGPNEGSRRHPKRNPNRSIPIPKTAGSISTPGLFVAGEIDGWITSVWAEKGSRSYARIRNNSKEPVGNVHLSLKRGREPAAVAQERSDMPKTLLPETEILVDVLVPRAGHRRGSLALLFTDSAGNRWERRGTRPPKLIPRPKRKRFHNLRVRRIRLIHRIKRLFAKT